MTMQLPLSWDGDPNADPNEVLGVLMAEASTFTSGLSIAFGDNQINVQGSLPSTLVTTSVCPGQRGPDVQLQKPGTLEPTRLHRETPNTARFHVIVFAGEPESTSPYLKAFSKAKECSQFLSNANPPISWLTIAGKTGPSAFELLGVTPFGKTFYDQKQTAHARYGVDIQKGAVVVLRPDGWVATATVLAASAAEELETYFKAVFDAPAR